MLDKWRRRIPLVRNVYPHVEVNCIDRDDFKEWEVNDLYEWGDAKTTTYATEEEAVNTAREIARRRGVDLWINGRQEEEM